MTRLVAIWSSDVENVCKRANELGIAHRLVGVVADGVLSKTACWGFYQLDSSMFDRVRSTPGLTWK